MGFFFMYNFSMIRENSFEFILYNISLLLLFVKCGLFLFRSTIHKTQSSIKLLMQSYYRLRLISMKGCHLLVSYNFLSTCRTYTPPISTLCKCVYGGGGGNRTLVQSTYHNCRQRPILCRNRVIIFIIIYI